MLILLFQSQCCVHSPNIWRIHSFAINSIQLKCIEYSKLIFYSCSNLQNCIWNNSLTNFMQKIHSISTKDDCITSIQPLFYVVVLFGFHSSCALFCTTHCGCFVVKGKLHSGEIYSYVQNLSLHSISFWNQHYDYIHAKIDMFATISMRNVIMVRLLLWRNSLVCIHLAQFIFCAMRKKKLCETEVKPRVGTVYLTGFLIMKFFIQMHSPFHLQYESVPNSTNIIPILIDRGIYTCIKCDWSAIEGFQRWKLKLFVIVQFCFYSRESLKMIVPSLPFNWLFP